VKRAGAVKRYLVSLTGLLTGLLACAVAFSVYLAPKQQRVQVLEHRVSSLESEKRAIQASLAPPDATAVHPHRHGAGGEHEAEQREAKMRAIRILGADQTLGVKAMQLRTIEALAAAAEEAGARGFSYQDLSGTAGSREQVAVVTRHPDGGAPHEQQINRYTLHLELLTDFEGLAGFLDRIETLPHVVVPREIRFSRGTDGATKAELALNGYFRVDP
jgi:hypothetical protein